MEPKLLGASPWEDSQIWHGFKGKRDLTQPQRFTKPLCRKRALAEYVRGTVESNTKQGGWGRIVGLACQSEGGRDLHIPFFSRWQGAIKDF